MSRPAGEYRQPLVHGVEVDPSDPTKASKAYLDRVEAMARVQATNAEIAAGLHVSPRTFGHALSAFPEIGEAIDAARARGRLALRVTQAALARKNAAMAIHLGKQYLGHADKTESSGNVTVNGEVRHAHVHTYIAMPQDERLARIAELQKKLGIEPTTGKVLGTLERKPVPYTPKPRKKKEPPQEEAQVVMEPAPGKSFSRRAVIVDDSKS